MTGIKAVAKRAGVSIATVSNVMNKRKPVSAELEIRVQKAISDLNYEVNPVGRGLKSNKTNQIGVIVPSFSQVYFPAILQGIHEAGVKCGYTVSVYETGGDVELEKLHVRFLQHSWSDGIILASYANIENNSDREYIWSLAEIGTHKKRIPVVSLENILGPSIDAVIVDNRKAAETAVKHLIDCGHKTIAHISAPTKFNIGELRLAGYRETLESNNIKFDDKFVCEGDFSPKSGYKCMQELLSRNLKFTAVFVANDQMAIGAMRALHEASIKIPEEVAIIGLDNNFPSTLVTPSLSSVNIPKFEMGYQAVELLANRIENPNAVRSVRVLDTKLVIRKSTSESGDSVWDLNNW
jgi:DNA-binding LacI/PurR family transcriptional regulator